MRDHFLSTMFQCFLVLELLQCEFLMCEPLLQVIFQALNFTPEERQKVLQHIEQEQSLLGWTGLSGLMSGV